MARLTGNSKNLKAKLLSTVKACVESRHPDFFGDHQQVRETMTEYSCSDAHITFRLAFTLIIPHSCFSQDAHEFLMVCLSHLKEEGELLQSYWPLFYYYYLLCVADVLLSIQLWLPEELQRGFQLPLAAHQSSRKPR